MVSIGEKAPLFKAKALVSGVEQSISLSDFKGKNIVLYFYPKDLTPGCTTQACNLRDNFSELERKGIIILGVSIDSIAMHQKFAQKEKLPFILISDIDKELVQKYGVWGEKSFMGRKYLGVFRQTFLIDEKGIIIGHIEKPDVKNHTKEILNLFSL